MEVFSGVRGCILSTIQRTGVDGLNVNPRVVIQLSAITQPLTQQPALFVTQVRKRRIPIGCASLNLPA
jgi:hypothetical protein